MTMPDMTQHQHQASRNIRYVFGTFDNEDTSTFIKKEKHLLEGAENQWATVAVSYWDTTKKIWIIDNSLLKTLDETFFNIIENEDTFQQMLTAHQQKHDQLTTQQKHHFH